MNLLAVAALDAGSNGIDLPWNCILVSAVAPDEGTTGINLL
jgi:hypothetical protein